MQKFGHMSIRHARYGAGFTLIELMVTLVIAAILAALSAPYMRDFITRNKVAGISNEFTGSLLRARNEAVSKNTCITMCTSTTASNDLPQCVAASSDWNAGWVLFINEACDPADTTPAAADLVLARGAGATHYPLSSSEADTNTITFDQRGNIRDGGVAGRFDLAEQMTHGKFNRSICLDRLGRTRLVDFESEC